MSSLLPLFPLPLVLFPGVRLPLHIFEPRYRQMLADCLAGERAFGVLFRPEGVDDDAIPLGQVGCVAHVERADSLPEGRANVVVTGAGRFVFERFEHTDLPYFVGQVSDYHDAAEFAPTVAPLADRVRELFLRVGVAARTLADDPDALPELPQDPALLAYSIAAVIDMDVNARQSLLASRSPSGRLRDIELLLAPAVESLELRATVHTRAKSNGHGHQPQSTD